MSGLSVSRLENFPCVHTGGRVSVLFIIDTLEHVDPVSWTGWHATKINSINQNGWSSRNLLGAVCLPHRSRVEVCIPLVSVVAINTINLSWIKIELGSDLVCPLLLEVRSADISLRQHNLKLTVINPILVLIKQAVALLSAKSLQVWHNLSDLKSVQVVWKWEWTVSPIDLVGYGAIQPWSCQSFIPNWIVVLTSAAEKIQNNLDLDTSLA